MRTEEMKEKLGLLDNHALLNMYEMLLIQDTYMRDRYLKDSMFVDCVGDPIFKFVVKDVILNRLEEGHATKLVPNWEALHKSEKERKEFMSHFDCFKETA